MSRRIVLALALAVVGSVPIGGSVSIGRAVFAAAQGGAAPPVVAPDPLAVARGRTAFVETCSACHGTDARGGAFGGVDLAQSAIAVANDDGRRLGAFLKVGRPEARMPSFALSDAVVADMSAFFRTLPAPAPGRGGMVAAVVGDAKAGEAYFAARGCATCHSITGDLKGIGTRYDAATIQGRAVMPRGRGGYPRSFLSPPDPAEAPRTVTITQPDGTKLSGALVWITDFYVAYTDASGIRRTVTRKGDVPRVEIVDPLQWHIQHMKTLNDKDMHDLTAYLVTLR